MRKENILCAIFSTWGGNLRLSAIRMNGNVNSILTKDFELDYKSYHSFHVSNLMHDSTGLDIISHASAIIRKMTPFIERSNCATSN